MLELLEGTVIDFAVYDLRQSSFTATQTKRRRTYAGEARSDKEEGKESKSLHGPLGLINYQ